MSGTIEFAAGFPGDLATALAACPAGGVLGDYTPFHDVFLGVGPAELTALFELVGAPRPWSGASLGDVGDVRARIMPAESVAGLAGVDDTMIGSLRRRWWGRVGGDGEPDPDLGQALRGLVVQCRAAAANGWVVAWWQSVPA